MAPNEHTLSILVVDEGVLGRKFLAEAVTLTPGATLAGVAANAAIAVQKLAGKPADLILLGLNAEEGFGTFLALRKAFPEIGIIIAGPMDEGKAPAMVRAMQAGALHFLPRPARLDLAAGSAELSRQLQPLLRHFSIQHTLRQAEPAPGSPPTEAEAVPLAPPKAGGAPAAIDLVAIAVSTGGPAALAEVIPLLPADLRAPVLIVQHMPAPFTAVLAESLDAKSRLTVKEAREGDPLQPGTVYIAPGGRHMTIRRVKGAGARLEIALDSGPPVKSCRPSADILFHSIAEAVDGQVLAVVMTGMGEDGADGVRRLKQRRCYCLSQSRETCVVYGMPRAVETGGLADEVLPLELLAGRIARLAGPR